MAISVIDGDDAGSSTSTTVDAPLPTGSQNGDLLVAMCSTARDTTGDWTPLPTDWVEVEDVTDGSGADRRIFLGYKIADNESEFTTFTNGASGRIHGSMVAIRGINTGQPLDVTYVRATHEASQQNDANIIPAPIDTVTDGALVLIAQFVSHDDITAWSPPSGYTAAHATVIPASFDRQHYWSYKIQASAGTATPGAFSHTENGTGTNDTNTFTLAIKPAELSGDSEIGRGIGRGIGVGIG